MATINEMFNDIEPDKRQKMVWVAAGIALFVVLLIFVMGTDDNQRKKIQHKTVTDVFTSSESEKLGAKAMGSQVAELRRAVSKMEAQQAKSNEQSQENYRALTEASSMQINQINEQLKSTERRLLEKDREFLALNEQIKSGAQTNLKSNEALIRAMQQLPPTESAGDTDGEESTGKQTKGIRNSSNTAVIENEWELFSSDDVPTDATNASVSTGPILSGYTKYEIKNTVVEEDEVIDSFNIPTGAIFSGVLINGLDSPTNKASKSDPMPVLLRVKHDTILPNRFKMDLKECFMLATGYGELSSERIMLRSEKLSCQKRNGDVVDIRLDAYAVSTVDGKAGVRGRLVSRNGRLLAMSMLSGLGSGLAQATKPQAIPVISNTGNNDTQFQSASTSDAFEAAAYNGASTALENLADYYLDMADQTFPILELDAGTKVDFIVHVGTVAEVTKALGKKRG